MIALHFLYRHTCWWPPDQQRLFPNSWILNIHMRFAPPEHIVVHRFHYIAHVLRVLHYSGITYSMCEHFGSVWENVCANRRTLSHTFIMIRHIQCGPPLRSIFFRFLLFRKLRIFRSVTIGVSAPPSPEQHLGTLSPFDGVDLVYLGPSFTFCAPFFFRCS